MLSPAASQGIPAALIRVEGVSCGYPGHLVLKDLSFSVQPGELVGVLGPNGSGKTTLILAMSGILPVESGRIEIAGGAVSDMKPRDRALRMAVVGQDADIRFPFSCEEVIRMGRYPHYRRWQMQSPEDAGHVHRAMDLTDTHPLAERLVTNISGGERQRVMMARALAQDTPLLLLDESTSAMDIHRKLQLFRMLGRLVAERQMTILAVLHDVNLAALFCSRMIFLKEGRLAADGPTDAVLTEKTLEEVYQARVLIHEVADIGKRQIVFLP